MKTACFILQAACLLGPVFAQPLESVSAQQKVTETFGSLKTKGAVDAAHIKKHVTDIGAPKPDTALKLHFSLKGNNLEGARRELHKRADPKSANYGKWLSYEEIQSYTAPTNETISKVKRWLTNYGVQDSDMYQPYPEWLAIKTTVAQAEQILNTTYSQYTHARLSAPLTRALSYQLPESLLDLINTVQPTTAFSFPSKPAPPSPPADPKSLFNSTSSHVPHSKRQSVSCDPLNWTKECFKSYYSINWTPSNQNGAQVGAMIFQASASSSDAMMYYGDGQTFSDITLSGSPNPGTASGEANLDTQMIGIAQPNNAYAIAAENPISDGLMDISNWLANDASSVAVTSTSFAIGETGTSNDYLTTVCDNFMKAGLAGRTIFSASGDDGCGGSNCRNFDILFPNSCPYVTSVGATQTANDGSAFPSQGDGRVGETAVKFSNTAGSGGGFSNVFSVPDFQKSQTQAYISGLNGYFDNLYNKNGRGYPDVSAFGFPGWIYYFNGQSQRIGGTSSSSPAWAAVASILNDQRLSQGKGMLGWLNPALYASGGNGLTDITTGNGYGGCGTGYPTAEGWDPVTGLGTPNYANLVNNLP